MRKAFIISIFFIVQQLIFAGDYIIHFTASGASSAIDSIIVENLNKGTAVTLKSDLILKLKDITTETVAVKASPEIISIVSNNTFDGNTLHYYAENSDNYTISVYNTLGVKMIDFSGYLYKGINSFDLIFPQGVYLVIVRSKKNLFSAKFISRCSFVNFPAIKHTGTVNKSALVQINKTRASENTSELAFSKDDILLFKGKSGNYTTLVSDIPTENKTINFEFVECKDAAGKHYAVTKIGNQIWMAENLAYLPMAASDAAVGSEDSGNECKPFCYVYDLEKYGVLYNWYAALTVAPSGWHLPSDAEWTALIDYLGGESVAGGKVKSTTMWNIPNIGATNSSCFSALPGGCRDHDCFNFAGYYGLWWSSTQNENDYAWNRYLLNKYCDFFRYNYDYKYYGFSVRCVRNDQSTPDPTDNYSLTLYSGNNQIGYSGYDLPEPVVLQVHNETGQLVVGYPVNISPFSGHVANNVLRTDNQGKVYIRWTLGNSTGKNSLQAFLKNSSGITLESTRIMIEATAIKVPVYDPDFKLILISGNDQTGCNGDVLNNPVVLQVTSSSTGIPIVGLPVNFICNSGSLFTSLYYSDGLGSGPVTDASGMVKVYWKMPVETGYVSMQAYLRNNYNELIEESGIIINANSINCTSPTVVTSAVTNITENSATAGGTITNNSVSEITQRGICWNTTGNPTIEDNHSNNGSGSGTFIANLSGLTADTTYYVRAYAIQNNITTYGEEISFKTKSNTPASVLHIEADLMIEGETTHYSSDVFLYSNGKASLPDFRWKELDWGTYWGRFGFLYTTTFSASGFDQIWGWEDTLYIHLLSDNSNSLEIGEVQNGTISFMGYSWVGLTTYRVDTFGGTFTLTRLR